MLHSKGHSQLMAMAGRTPILYGQFQPVIKGVKCSVSNATSMDKMS